MTYRECYLYGVESLKNAGIAEYELDARLLLEEVCDTNYNTLILDGEREVAVEDFEKYQSFIARRMERIPLQHITGKQDFCGFTFCVNEHVLIPRQDTEILVEEALSHIKSDMHLLDMCTGSGCILISLLKLSGKKNVTGVGVDLSKEALKVAVENARLNEVEEQCKWLESDLFSALDEEEKNSLQTFDMIVSNPPYIATKEIETLMPEVKEFEPFMALDGKEDGLFFYRRIVGEAGKYLSENGYLLFEIGYNQGEAVAGLMKDMGYMDVKVKKDYAGLDRVVFGRKG